MTVDPPARFEELHHEHYSRYLWDAFSPTPGSVNYSPTADMVYLTPVQVYHTVTLSHLGFIRGSGAPGGAQVRLGIYADAGDTPLGGALLGSTGDTAVIAGTIQKQEIALSSDLQLTPGLYWFALVEDTGGGGNNRIRRGHQFIITGTVTLDCYNYAAGAFTLADPCPALTNQIQAIILFGLVTSSP